MKHTKQILQSLLALSLVVCSSAMATESGVAGASTTANVTVDSSTLWVSVISTLVTPDTTFPDNNTYHCAVTCAATFSNETVFQGNNDANYLFGINTSTAAPPSGSRRIVSFPENTGLDDADWGPVATTYLFTGRLGSTSTTFHCLARKVASSDPTGVVTDSSITIVCSDHLW